jgi:hypothetical protein
MMLGGSDLEDREKFREFGDWEQDSRAVSASTRQGNIILVFIAWNI